MLAVLLCWLPSAHAQVAPATAETAPIRLSPDVAEIAQMAKAGVSNSVIVARIKLSPRPYNLTPQDVLNLDKLGVPTELVLAMIDHDAALARGAAGGGTAPAAESAAPAGAAAAKETPPSLAARQAIRREGGVVVLPIPEPAGSGTNRAPQLKRPWTSSMVVDKAPPSPKLELIPDAPDRNYVWIKGNWAWRGGRWVWDEGYWAARPGPDVVWLDGFWSRHGKGWIWVPGRWR